MDLEFADAHPEERGRKASSLFSGRDTEAEDLYVEAAFLDAETRVDVGLQANSKIKKRLQLSSGGGRDGQPSCLPGRTHFGLGSTGRGFSEGAEVAVTGPCGR